MAKILNNSKRVLILPGKINLVPTIAKEIDDRELIELKKNKIVAALFASKEITVLKEATIIEKEATETAKK